MEVSKGSERCALKVSDWKDGQRQFWDLGRSE